MNWVNSKVRNSIFIFLFIIIFFIAFHKGLKFPSLEFSTQMIITFLFFLRWWIQVLINSLIWQNWLANDKCSLHWMETFHTSIKHLIMDHMLIPGKEVFSHLQNRYRALWGISFKFSDPDLNLDSRSWLSFISFILALLASIQFKYLSVLSILFLFLYFIHIPHRLKLRLCSRHGFGFLNMKLIYADVTTYAILILFLILFSNVGFGLVLLFMALHLVFGFTSPFKGAGIREIIFLSLAISIFPSSEALVGVIYQISIYASIGTIIGVLSGWGVLHFYRNVRNYKPVSYIESKPISIIIPTFNEEEEIGKTITHLKSHSTTQIEILVVDGGSSDNTVKIARQLDCSIYHCSRGRGAQLRLGSEKAQFDILLFCHADTLVENGFDIAILRCLMDPNVAWGGFWKRFKNPHWIMRGSRFRCWLRWLISQRAFGDQLIFTRRQNLAAVGGVPSVPLMEEFEMARLFKKYRCGHLGIADSVVYTSTRKYKKLGILKTYWRMALVTFMYHTGVSLEKIDRIYRKS